jgi:hypothetical protein
MSHWGGIELFQQAFTQMTKDFSDIDGARPRGVALTARSASQQAAAMP